MIFPWLFFHKLPTPTTNPGRISKFTGGSQWMTDRISAISIPWPYASVATIRSVRWDWKSWFGDGDQSFLVGRIPMDSRIFHPESHLFMNPRSDQTTALSHTSSSSWLSFAVIHSARKSCISRGSDNRCIMIVSISFIVLFTIHTDSPLTLAACFPSCFRQYGCFQK